MSITSITSCDYCNSDHANLKCSKCKCVYYCSQNCQKKDWKKHKVQCDKGDPYFARFQAKESEIHNIINAHMGLEEYNVAMKHIRDLKKSPHASWDDKFFANIKGSQCAYYLGSYRESVVLGKLALKCNRHNAGVHQWIALSKKALGQWDEAVLTMRRAVRYETPWNVLHTQRCQKLLDVLLLEQQEQLQK